MRTSATCSGRTGGRIRSSPGSVWYSRITRSSVTVTSPTAGMTPPVREHDLVHAEGLEHERAHRKDEGERHDREREDDAVAYGLRGPSRGLSTTECRLASTHRASSRLREGFRKIPCTYRRRRGSPGGATRRRPPRRPPPRRARGCAASAVRGVPSPTGTPSTDDNGTDPLHRGGQEDLVRRTERLGRHDRPRRPRCRARSTEREDARCGSCPSRMPASRGGVARRPSRHEVDVGRRGLGDLAALVQHDRVVRAGQPRLVEREDVVEVVARLRPGIEGERADSAGGRPRPRSAGRARTCRRRGDARARRSRHDGAAHPGARGPAGPAPRVTTSRT